MAVMGNWTISNGTDPIANRLLIVVSMLVEIRFNNLETFRERECGKLPSYYLVKYILPS